MQVITLAFLVVGGSVGFMIPIMLYVLDLKKSGWNWQYVSLFISMLASTDAVAIISTMKTSASFWTFPYKTPCTQLAPCETKLMATSQRMTFLGAFGVQYIDLYFSS